VNFITWIKILNFNVFIVSLDPRQVLQKKTNHRINANRTRGIKIILLKPLHVSYQFQPLALFLNSP